MGKKYVRHILKLVPCIFNFLPCFFKKVLSRFSRVVIFIHPRRDLFRKSSWLLHRNMVAFYCSVRRARFVKQGFMRVTGRVVKRSVHLAARATIRNISGYISLYMIKTSIFVCPCNSLSLLLYNIGFGSAKTNLKTSVFVCLCAHVSLYM